MAPPEEIRGIVGDARESGMDQDTPPTVYLVLQHTAAGHVLPGLDAMATPAAMAETIRRKNHEIEPRRSVYSLTPLMDHISDAYAENRLRTTSLAFFAATAVSLACVGLYAER